MSTQTLPTQLHHENRQITAQESIYLWFILIIGLVLLVPAPVAFVWLFTNFASFIMAIGAFFSGLFLCHMWAWLYKRRPRHMEGPTFI